MAENRNSATGILTALEMLLFLLFTAPDLVCVLKACDISLSIF